MQLTQGFGRVDKRVLASYILDWLVLLIIGLICYGLNKINPNYHPFSLVDLSIQQAATDEVVSSADLIVASVILPGILIIVISSIVVPGPHASKDIPLGLRLRRKAWEINIGLLGLALAEMLALLITVGLKNMIGKPRPNMLAHCQPDTSPEAIKNNTVGAYAQGFNPYWVLVGRGICTQTNTGVLNDAFRSFPSGHSSTSWSGLGYFALWLAAKFAVSFPHLPETPASRSAQPTVGEGPQRQQEYARLGRSSGDTHRPVLAKHSTGVAPAPFHGRRAEAAAPPLYLLFVVILPIGTATFIAASRWYDFRHHGFDIISGSLIGAVTAVFAFRWYHMPLSRGSGWAWGPRSKGRAFGIGVGSGGFVSPEEAEEIPPSLDVEMGTLPQHRPQPAGVEDGRDTPSWKERQTPTTTDEFTPATLQTSREGGS